MIDTTLLDSTEPISMEALQAFFQANDFSTMVSRYSNWGVPVEKDALYHSHSFPLCDQLCQL